jgi:hypothetical protein
MGGACGTHWRGEEKKVYRRFWCEILNGRDHLEDEIVDVRMGLEWIFWRLAEGVWIGSIWLRIGAGGGLL